MPLPENPLDLVASNLAVWADELSSRIAEAIQGGLSAPGAAKLSEQQKLEYYSAAFFNPDGSPNMSGRAREMQRLGPLGFAETFKEVLRAHPNYRHPDWDSPQWRNVSSFTPSAGGPTFTNPNPPIEVPAHPLDSVVSYTPPGASGPTYTNPSAVEAG